MIETVEAALKEKSTEALAILKISNKKVKVKLDTGTEVNVMPMRVFKQIEDGHGYGGTSVPVEVKIKVMCEF